METNGWQAIRFGLNPEIGFPVEFQLRVDATKDFLFRIDDEDVSAPNSKLLIRNLIVEDQKPALLQ